MKDMRPEKTKLLQHRKDSGFTLVELLVVLAILGLLAGLVGPRIIRQLGSAKVNAAQLQIENLGAALDLFYLNNSRYPSSAEGLAALVQAPAGLEHWNGPYLKKGKVPTDPWGQPYHYQSPGNHGPYDLYSLGADQRLGGDDQDITNWE